MTVVWIWPAQISNEVSVLLQIYCQDTGEPKTGQTYTVKSGDTLWDIANKFDTTVSKLVQANFNIIDPDLIYPGQVILIN